MKKGEFLLKRMESKGLNMRQLSRESGVPYTTIRSMIERDLKKAAIENVIAVCQALDVGIDDLTRLDNPGLPENLKGEADYTIKIPIIGVIAAGAEIVAEQNIIGYITESGDGLPSGKLFALRIKGDSMEPTIPNGAIVTIREQCEVENGEIAAVQLNGDTDATLKRVKRQGDMMVLVPDNSKYDPYVVTSDNPARIIGKAVRYSRNL
ncbi:LexA family transcriptional regulator [Planococcus sp. A6]|uniref:LexA family protein n=1 Tax=Planococcus sp. A6 TaxID=2992760 RepID=UPI00237BA482|nr:LexA family transcriptional regulator [Planococcus sp. A6]MDE0582200.1 LexA family transcriptional regulator [Planococcus sp. A6]